MMVVEDAIIEAREHEVIVDVEILDLLAHLRPACAQGGPRHG